MKKKAIGDAEKKAMGDNEKNVCFGFVIYRKQVLDFLPDLCYNANEAICLLRDPAENRLKEETDHASYSDHRNTQPLRERKERRLRRMPDILPVRLQDELRYCQSAVRKQEDRKTVMLI